MAIIKVQAYPGYITVAVAGETINDLHTVMTSPIGGVVEAKSGYTELGIGVARGTVVSGALARFVTHGIVSGVICAAAVQAGDRLTIGHLTSGPGLASGPGLVTPFNTITPAGYPVVSGALLMSGYFASGFLSGVLSGYGYPISGFVRANISGAFVGTAYNTGRVIGRALISGGVGSGIKMMVSVE